MTYGPTAAPTQSPLAFDQDGKPVLFWDHGLKPGVGVSLPRLPKILVDLETQEGHTALALFPSGVSRRLSSDAGKELVLEHHALIGSSTLGLALAAYLVTEQRSDQLVKCTLIVHSGACNPRIAGSWPGCLRFKKIRVRVITPGWEATTIDCGPPGDWYFGIRQAFVEHFVCHQISIAARDAAYRLQAMADLVIPNPMPCIGAGRHSLPRMVSGRAEPLWTNVAPMGPLWPDIATEHGYDSGGAGIQPIGGWEVNEVAARSYVTDLTRVLSRMGVALAHTGSGEPIWPEDWPNHGVYGLFDNRYSVDPWNWAGQAGTIVGMFGWNRQQASGPREINPGPCTSRTRALGYQPHNGEHYQRLTSRALPAWQLARDWAARWALRMGAADVMNSWPVQGTLGQRLQQARDNPGRGGDYLRFQAWLGEAVAAATSMVGFTSGQNVEERARYLDWRAHYLEYQSLIPLSNGFARDGRAYVDPMTGKIGGSDNGVPWIEGLPLEYGACAVFQLSFHTSMIYDLTVNGPPLPQIPKSKLDWMMTEGERQLLAGPLVLGSPPVYVGVTKNGQAENPIKAGSVSLTYTGHANHDHHALVLASKLTGDQKWRKLMTKLGPAFPSALAQLSAMRAKPHAWNILPIAVGGGV